MKQDLLNSIKDIYRLIEKIPEEDLIKYGVVEAKSYLVRDVINFLNEVCGTSYKATSAKNKSLILSRKRDGYKLEDFKTVIVKKHKEWAKTEMAVYLRPETLFSHKFESYLNQLESTPKATTAEQRYESNAQASKVTENNRRLEATQKREKCEAPSQADMDDFKEKMAEVMNGTKF